LRAVGGNGRRTSHNPPDAAMLDIYDRLGVVVMDENRLFGNESAYIANMGAMLKRDRNHASVAIWYFCNTPTLALPLLQP
jgi:beta-galactosidase|tara:strand:- start:274 stop:513 length:240 start_codon:yes stop_codon:yes gene_type:complete